jgi:organic radical activating enzyme
MKAPVSEIFSSIQGEGILMGRRQIFIRFSGCNLDCKYCDTINSKNNGNEDLLTINEVVDRVNELITPDLHSISFTGGEPTLYPEFINEMVNSYANLKILLETNATLPEKIGIIDNITYASVDIKLPEHFYRWDPNIFKNELRSIEILMEKKATVYCKLVILPSTKINKVEELIIEVSKKTNDYNIPLIIQPSSPIRQWKKDKKKILKFSEVCGKYMDVLTIPQVHKCLGLD